MCKPANQLVAVMPDRGPVESESHFLFLCVSYDAEREYWLGKMTLPHDFHEFPLESKLELVLN